MDAQKMGAFIAQCRKEKQMTQEQLAQRLQVTDKAVSRWERGRGYPSIDSLKAIAEFFGVTIDELLSNRELICIAEKDSHQKTQHMRDLVFGLIDCSVVMLFFIPLFGQQGGEIIRQVSLLSLQETPLFIKVAYFAIILLTVACGIATLALQNYSSIIWIKTKTILSMILTIISVVIFIASLQPYVAFFTFVLLIIKGALLLKRP